MAIVRKDKLLAGYNGNLESVKIFDNAGAEKVESTNGVFVVVEGLLEGREAKKARLASDVEVEQDVLFIHNSEVMYDERLSKLADFRIKKNKVARAYRLYDGDIITLTDDLFADATVDADGKVVRPTYTEGTELAVKADGKIGTFDSATVSPKVVFEVIEDASYELDPQMQAFAVQVKRK
jgi:hypothetical protein